MPQVEGAGTQFSTGPGSTFRGPLYVRSGPVGASPVASGDAQTFYPIFDAFGNPIQPQTGTLWKELTIAVPNASVKTLHSVPFLLVAAPGAGLLLDPDTIILDYLYLTGAFTAGGVIQVSYGAGATAASTTIAATFLTSPAANQMAKLSANNSAVNQLSSAVLNTGLYLYSATQDFATGGGSLIVNISYRVVQGLS